MKLRREILAIGALALVVVGCGGKVASTQAGPGAPDGGTTTDAGQDGGMVAEDTDASAPSVIDQTPDGGRALTSIKISGDALAHTNNGHLIVAGTMAHPNDANQLGLGVGELDIQGRTLWRSYILANPDPKDTGGVSLGSLVYQAQVGATGNIYLSGITPGPFPGEKQHGSDDAFFCMTDSKGALKWAHQFGTYSGMIWDSAVDAAGNYYAGKLDGTPPTMSSGSPGTTVSLAPEFFIAKYDTKGRELWSKALDVSYTTKFDTADAVAHQLGYSKLSADAAGNTYLLSTDTVKLVSTWRIQKFDPSGSQMWKKELPEAACTASDTSDATSTASDDGSSIYFNTGACLIRVDSSGKQVWKRRLAGLGPDNTRLAVSDDGAAVYIASPRSDVNSAIIMRYGNDGKLVWSNLVRYMSSWFAVESTGTQLLFVSPGAGGIFKIPTGTGDKATIISYY